MYHVVELGNLEISITNYRIINGMALRFLNIFHPSIVIIDRVDTETDYLAVTFIEFRF